MSHQPALELRLASFPYSKGKVWRPKKVSLQTGIYFGGGGGPEMRLSGRSFVKSCMCSCFITMKVVTYIINISSHRSECEMIKQETFNQAAFGGWEEEKELMDNTVLETGESITCHFF